MKICFITDTIFNLGGIQRVLSVLAGELVEYYDVDVICTSNKFKIDRDLYNLNEKVNINMKPELLHINLGEKISLKLIKIINDKTGFLNKESNIDYLTKIYYPKIIQRRIIKYLNNKSYDVIIGVAGYFSILLGIIDNELKAKTIGWQHNSYEAYFKTPYKYYWRREELFKKYVKRLNEYIVLTDDDKKILNKDVNLECERIYNPLSFTSNEKSKCEEKVIVCVGRLVEQQKGLDLLINSFKKVSIKHKDWMLYIVGDGPDKNSLNILIRKLDLENQVKIKSFTNDIKEYYLNSSIFVSSSRWEGFGLVITEAMECGLPVIAFSNSGPKEIINKQNENGVLVPCWDIDKLSEAIINLIENEEKRKNIGKASIERANDFSKNIILEQWKAVIDRI
jgi:glycosyltransferase involved in cell wall biosynthesis